MMRTDNPSPAAAAADKPAQPPHQQRAAATSPAAPGSAAPADGERLGLPHERDQSDGTAGDAPHDVIQQAKKDLDAGLVDTDLHAEASAEASRRLGTPNRDG